jgi:hypothetical protein
MTKIFAFMNQRWFQVLVIGAILFFGTEQALKFTNNINFVPTVILIGAFLVPVTMVTYFYSQSKSWIKPAILLSLSRWWQPAFWSVASSALFLLDS